MRRKVLGVGGRNRLKHFKYFRKIRMKSVALVFPLSPALVTNFEIKNPLTPNSRSTLCHQGPSVNLSLTPSLFSFLIPRKHNKMLQMFKKKPKLKSSFSRTKSVTFFFFWQNDLTMDRYKFHCFLSRHMTKLFLLYSVLFISYSVQQKQQKKNKKKEKKERGGGALIYTVAMNRLDWVLTQQAGDGLDCLFQD